MIDCKEIQNNTICSKCYGEVVGFEKIPDQYPAGLIAAQSIGERGTQLSMASFHTGDSAVTIKDVVRRIKYEKEDFNSFCKKLKSVSAYKNIEDRHFKLMWIAFNSSGSKSLENLWENSRSTFSALGGPGASTYLKENKTGKDVHIMDTLLRR